MARLEFFGDEVGRRAREAEPCAEEHAAAKIYAARHQLRCLVPHNLTEDLAQVVEDHWRMLALHVYIYIYIYMHGGQTRQGQALVDWLVGWLVGD